MALDFTLLQRKLNAIRANYADADGIVARQTEMPFAGKRNKTQWQQWLQKRIDVLEQADAGKWTDAQVHTFVTNLRDSLSAGDRAIADSIWAGESWYDLSLASGSTAHDKLCAIILYRLVAPTAT